MQQHYLISKYVLFQANKLMCTESIFNMISNNKRFAYAWLPKQYTG